MAQYQHLPIYKTAYDLFRVILRVTRHFPRDLRYVIGDPARDDARDLVVLVIDANSSRNDRVENIKKILKRVQRIDFLLRASKDEHGITVKQFSDVVALTDSLGRQAQGWLKSSASLAES